MLLRPRVVAVVAVLALGLGACGGDNGDSGNGHAHGEAPQSFAFGEPGDAGAAERTIEITATDPYAFDPEEVAVEVGETVTFSVRNDGGTEHEFVLGDEDLHESHAAESSDHGDTAFAVVLEPGDSKELTWTFTEEGEVLYVCHIEGHYEEGMFGTIDVS